MDVLNVEREEIGPECNQDCDIDDEKHFDDDPTVMKKVVNEVCMEIKKGHRNTLRPC